MFSRDPVLFVLTVVVCSGFASASERPVAVSPGSATGTTIAGPCPTFSWGQLEAAVSYELVVYRVDEGGGDTPRLVLSQRISGPALGWTPSLDRCLERGEPYAWSVRAVTGEGLSDWADPMLFKVTSRPSAEEIAAALEVVRRHLATDDWTDDWRESAASVGGFGGIEPQAVIASTPALAFVKPGGNQLRVEGEVRTVDPGGEPRLWGRGRPGGIVYGASGGNACTNGNIAFGLAASAVGWGSAADACPAGSWVCRQSDLVACNTVRPDENVDGRFCDGLGFGRSSANHLGWVADSSGTDLSGGRAFSEAGSFDDIRTCWTLPVWCCWPSSVLPLPE